MAAPDNPNPQIAAELHAEEAAPPVAAGLHPEVPPLPAELQTGYQPNISDLLKQRHAETARRLSGWLLAILAGGIVLHYICLMALIFFNKGDDAIKVVEDLFHSWLPVVAGLAGGATTYYFTKDGK